MAERSFAVLPSVFSGVIRAGMIPSNFIVPISISVALKCHSIIKGGDDHIAFSIGENTAITVIQDRAGYVQYKKAALIRGLLFVMLF